jgi:transposase
LVQQQTRLKNRIHGIFHRNLVLGCPRSDLFGKGGRKWLTNQATPRLPQHEQATVEAMLREFDVVHDELTKANRLLAVWALDHADVRRLLTIPGVDTTIALALVAAIADVHRFA